LCLSFFDPSVVGIFSAGRLVEGDAPAYIAPVGARRWQLDQLVEDVTLLGRRGLPREEYYGEVAGRLRRVVDCDATCWHTLDPQTRLITSDAGRELIDAGVFTPANISDAGALILASEYFVKDVNTFAGLAARRVPVGILSQVTNGKPERSARYRDLLAPSGIPFELRAAFVSRGRCWGAVHIARRGDKRDFTVEDANVLARITGAIAEGLRTTLRLDAARLPATRAAPGLVVLSANNDVELITPPAHELLAAMRNRSQAPDDETPPQVLLALAAFIRRSSQDPERPDAVAVPTSSGWITLHASLPDGGAGGKVAIVLERAPSPQSTAIRLEVHGVTPREREIATLLAQGLSNPEIATRLVLSPYTVQDHIKNLFEKTEVSSRQELVARVFLDEYLPQLAAAKPTHIHRQLHRPRRTAEVGQRPAHVQQRTHPNATTIVTAIAEPRSDRARTCGCRRQLPCKAVGTWHPARRATDKPGRRNGSPSRATYSEQAHRQAIEHRAS
jgi:DNA-binding CsgD family transcriptional regulator